MDNPGTISVTPVHGDTLTEEYIVGYAWKDSPWIILGLYISVTPVHGDTLTEE